MKRRNAKFIAFSLSIILIVLAAGAWWLDHDNEQQNGHAAYANPVFDHDAPDPTVMKAEDGYYYAISTQSKYDGSVVTFPILQSADLVHWEAKGAVFPPEQIPSWATLEYMWAPHLTFYKGKYYVYYSTKVNDGDALKGMGIGVAIADHPLGPYKDSGGPVVWGTRFEKIDPFVLDDDDGKRYLYWGSDKQPIYVQQLADNGLSVIGEAKDVIQPNVQSRKMYDILVEGPWVVKRSDYYYMFFSGDYCCVDSNGKPPHYAVMVARSKSPAGPFEPNKNNPIVELNENFVAPGHNAVIQDDAGTDWLLYHAFKKADTAFASRVLMLDRIDWKDGWPVVNDGHGPSSGLQKNGPITNKLTGR
ncbi:glycoside hydrolase family 43 protein [Paenibacillus sp. BC26]|uniref:glycoside hydrolase family 43 protein n=1 Tax=Paenibacillus sp. BC26 TaxID=1881032 RepID=UPI0008DF32D6|nr:family 43 glycosylhydrolase [Paenibacillus sp. BC26]SFT14984.1 arabinan endo-1,5-alpha-L-arabinosidase [Paenibacillus sp. BC26]